MNDFNKLTESLNMGDKISVCDIAEIFSSDNKISEKQITFKTPNGFLSLSNDGSWFFNEFEEESLW